MVGLRVFRKWGFFCFILGFALSGVCASLLASDQRASLLTRAGNFSFGTWQRFGGMPDLGDPSNIWAWEKWRQWREKIDSPVTGPGLASCRALLLKTPLGWASHLGRTVPFSVSSHLKKNFETYGRPSQIPPSEVKKLSSKDVLFFDENGIPTSNRTWVKHLFFPDSKIDRIRNFYLGLSEFRSYQGALIGKSFRDLEGELEPLLLENRLTPPKLYLYRSAGATRGENLKRLAQADWIRARTGFFGAEAKAFVEYALLPLVARSVRLDRRKGGWVRARGKYSPYHLSKNLRLNWGAQGYGATFVQELINGLVAYMKRIGYSEQQIDQSIRNIFVLVLSGAAPVRSPGPSPTVVWVEDLKDDMALISPRMGVYPEEGTVRRPLGEDGLGIHVTDRRWFFWTDFEIPSDAPEPDYDYHDIRFVLSHLPRKVREIWLKAYQAPAPLPGLSELVE